MVEVKEDSSKRRLLGVLSGHFKDNSQAYRLESDGTYQRFKPKKGKKNFKAQDYFHRFAVQEAGRVPEASEMRLLPHRPPGQSVVVLT